MAQFAFNATEVTPEGGRVPLPKGTYKVAIFSSDIKPNGENIRGSVNYRVLEGPLTGHSGIEGYTLKHSNADAERIGRAQYSALHHACGVRKSTSPADLHGKPFIVDVDQDEQTATKDGVTSKTIYNRITAYRLADGSAFQPFQKEEAPPPSWTPGAATPPTSAEPLFYAAHNNAYLNDQKPLTAAALRALGLPLDQVLICKKISETENGPWERANAILGETAPTPLAAPTVPAGTVSEKPPWT